MNQSEVIKLSKQPFHRSNIDVLFKEVQKKYHCEIKDCESSDLIKALESGKPVFVKDNLIIGAKSGQFICDNEQMIPVERMVKAIIVSGERTEQRESEPFAIIGENRWTESITEFDSIIKPLMVGEIFLPPHSAVFNFLPKNDALDKKTVAEIVGVTINIYDPIGYIDNCFHEIGHMVWRDCVLDVEKKDWIKFSKMKKKSALFEYEWESKNEQEIFCTIYKWYLKSILLNKSFMNILEFEEPKGLEMIRSLFARIAADRQKSDEWELSKDIVFDYLQPKRDPKTGLPYVKFQKGTFESVKDVIIPEEVIAKNIDGFEDGTVFIKLNKARIPLDSENRIKWDKVRR